MRTSSPSLLIPLVLVGMTAQISSSQFTKRRVEEKTCGAECLYIALSMLGKSPNRFTKLIEGLGVAEPDGYSMLTLRNFARKQGCFAECVSLSPSQLSSACKVALVIVRVKPNHYRICLDVRDNRVEYVDPGGMRGTESLDDLTSVWGGECLVVSDKPIVIRETRHFRIQFVLAIVAGAIMLMVLKWQFGRR